MTPTASNQASAARAHRWRVAAWFAIATALAAVFAAYLSPHFVVDLANRVWSCL